MKRIIFGVFALLLPLGALAVDADGFFYAKPISGFLGEVATKNQNGVLQAIYKQEEGILLLCMSKKKTSKECDSQWIPPSAAVKQLVQNSCYLGFELISGDPVFFYRVKRPCS